MNSIGPKDPRDCARKWNAVSGREIKINNVIVKVDCRHEQEEGALLRQIHFFHSTICAIIASTERRNLYFVL